MTALACTTVRTLAPELALGVLDGAERAEALAHVESCARCQAFVAELTEAVDLMPLLVEEREPPPGFEQRVLASILPTGAARRWRIARLAAAAAAVLALVVGTAAIVGSSGDAPRREAAARGATPLGAAMVGTSGNVHAGWVWVTGRHSVLVTVDYAVPMGRYRIELRPPSGAPTVLGEVSVDRSHASWSGSSGTPIGPGSTIAMVGADGSTVCQARLV